MEKMMASINESPLYPILNPQSIAFFGASNRFSAMGTILFSSLQALGFKGDIHPVHPVETEVLGLKAYKSVSALPKVPDLAVIVLPSRAVLQVMEECGKKGIKHAIVVSGGFKETGEEGLELERDLLKVANRYGIRFLGPNCIGVVNPYTRLNTALLDYRGSPGFIGIASQSGSFVTQMFDYLSRFGLGLSAGISVGNEADMDMVDCIEYLNACPKTKVIALYVENIRRGREFMKAARAITPHKPIVAFYAGGTEAGRRAAKSHTGALAGPDGLYDGVFSQSGVIRAGSIEELFDFCWVLGACPLPAGRNVVILTHSGGPGVVTADSSERAGLGLSRLSPKAREGLAPLLPDTGSIGNPVDVTFTKAPADYFSKIPRVLLDENNTDGLIIYFLEPELLTRRTLEIMNTPDDRMEREIAKLIREECRMIGDLSRNSSKPIIGFSFRTRDDHLVRGIQDQRVPVLPSPGRAARAMAALVHYSLFSKSFGATFKG